MDTTANPYYTVQDLASLWKVPNSTIYTMISTGRLNAFKAGSSWRITEASRVEAEKTNSNTARLERVHKLSKEGWNEQWQIT